MEKRIPLSLRAEGPAAPPLTDAPSDDFAADHPVIGYLAVACGLLGIFSWGLIFVPMSLAFSIAALVAGQGTWGFAGLVLTGFGIANSPSIWVMGVGAIAAAIGIPLPF
ncbi:MAG: hypothetical protein VW268_07160 [Rhodospirillaceae bacterium]